MNFYNDNDLKICAWLRELIKAGLIPDGVVDSRSIELIKPDELKPYTQCHFFAGIGGWSEALRLAGWPTDVPVWTGSCPCQPYSCAGKGKGNDDPRNVWPNFKRLIEACHPPVVFGEQVASKAGREWLSGVFADLEALGYSRAGADLCAASVGAPHIRQRLYWMGHANREQTHTSIHRQFLPGSGCDSPDWNREAVQGVGEMEAFRLADANLSERDGRTRIREQQIRFKGKNTVGLAESEGQQHDRSGDARGRRGESSDDCGLGDTNNAGSQGRDAKELSECSSEQAAGAGGSSGGMGKSESDNEFRNGKREASDGRIIENRRSSSWSDCELLACRDGKQRRTQSGVCPLAHGVPARVVRLRGYGNAIVPQVAAEFIGAYMDCYKPPAALTRGKV